MNQIAIGDPMNGFTVLEGQDVSPPYFKATLNLAYTGDDFLREKIEIELRGTPVAVNIGLVFLETVLQRSQRYEETPYMVSQFLRFQLEPGGDYFYTPISELVLSANPAAYRKKPIGSIVLMLHYTRPNWFDGQEEQVPLTGRTDTDTLDWYEVDNVSSLAPLRGNSVLIKKDDINTIMPAPIRLEYVFATSSLLLRDLFVGIFNHYSYTGDDIFFGNYLDLDGGTHHEDGGALDGWYRSVTWSGSAWTAFTKYLADLPDIAYFAGRSFRPILRLFNPHAYTDLYFRVQIEYFGEVLTISEPIYSPPGVGFLMLPPIELPPSYLMREVAPSRLHVALHARRISGASTTVTFDSLTIFPLIYSASFHGFINLEYNYVLIDDSHRQRHNTRRNITAHEIVTHTRSGTDLLLNPNENSRIFFSGTNENFLIPLGYKGWVKVYYRPRMRIL